LYEHLDTVANPWAQRIATRKPYRVAIELHNQEPIRTENVKSILENKGIDTIWASSNVRLSKYHQTVQDLTDNSNQIYVVDQYDKWDVPSPIGNATQIFSKYEGARVIDRIYVAPENFDQAKLLLSQEKY
jgi:hypothetical protein